MDTKRLRSLTTGILHSEMSHVYEDIEYLTGTKGVMTHMIPNAIRAMEPWLRKVVTDEKFWEKKYDTTDVGEIDVPVMTRGEQVEMWERYKALPSLLEGKDVVVVVQPERN